MISTQQAKTISIVEYLNARGIKHAFTRRGEYWYNSPFRKEMKPSFAVKERAGSYGEDLWDDFGNGGGGSIIDLAMALESLTHVSDALFHLERYYKDGMTVSHRQKHSPHPSLFTSPKENTIKNIVIRPLNHFVLLQYLESRGISASVAKQHLKLIWYENNGRKNLFSLGWQNNSGAWELRSNQSGKNSFKAVTGKKDISLIPSNQPNIQNLYIFEGMLDFLSALELKKSMALNGDVVILNSTTLISRVAAFINKRSYTTIYTFFDNDGAGEKAFKKLTSSIDHNDIRPQTFYRNHKDVNEYLVASLLKKKKVGE